MVNIVTIVLQMVKTIYCLEMCDLFFTHANESLQWYYTITLNYLCFCTPFMITKTVYSGLNTTNRA
jgi:hypothetical protein